MHSLMTFDTAAVILLIGMASGFVTGYSLAKPR